MPCCGNRFRVFDTSNLLETLDYTRGNDLGHPMEQFHGPVKTRRISRSAGLLPKCALHDFQTEL